MVRTATPRLPSVLKPGEGVLRANMIMSVPSKIPSWFCIAFLIKFKSLTWRPCLLCPLSSLFPLLSLSSVSLSGGLSPVPCVSQARSQHCAFTPVAAFPCRVRWPAPPLPTYPQHRSLGVTASRKSALTPLLNSVLFLVFLWHFVFIALTTRDCFVTIEKNIFKKFPRYS